MKKFALNRTVLVTGGAGFIGSHLVDRLIEHGQRVTVIDDLSSGNKKNVHRRASLVKMDIRSPRLGEIFRRVRPSVVFHLAAQKNVRTSVERPLYDADINIAGSLNVIECAHRAGTKTFVFSSTGGALYGDGVRLPTPETVPPIPLSPYGIAKFTIEQYLAFYGREFGMRTVSLRYANVYGPRQDPKGEAGVVAIFAQRLLRHQPLVVNGSGIQTRDYVYVDDVVTANVRAMLHNITGRFNIGTGVQTSVTTLASTLGVLSGEKFVVKHGPALSGEVMKSALDCSNAKKSFKWKPTVTLKAGLRSTYEWATSEWS